MHCSPPGSSVHGISHARVLEWVAFPFSPPGDLPHAGIEPRSPALQTDSLPPEPQGKPKNTGVGSLSLLQQIFPTQELNQGLLLCRRILYQLSYEGWWRNPLLSIQNRSWGTKVLERPQFCPPGSLVSPCAVCSVAFQGPS